MHKSPLHLADYTIAATAIKEQILAVVEREANHPGIQNFQNVFRRHPERCFQWVKSPDTSAENNFAERGLRPSAIARKISFGAQSKRGLKTREILMTILHTVRGRGHNPAEFLEHALDLLAQNDLAAVIRLFFPVTEKTAAARPAIRQGTELTG